MTRDDFYRRNFQHLWSTGLLRLALGPLASLLMNPLNLVRSLWNCRVLSKGRWSSYTGFSSGPAFLKLFYSVQAANLQRHGLRGTSRTMGSGTLAMTSFWYQSMLGTTLQWRLGTVMVVLLGMGAWVGAHLTWLTDATVARGSLLLTVSLATASTNFFGNLFDRQNYNALGWALFPAILWATVDAHSFVLGVLLLLTAFLSITVSVMAGVVVATIAVMHGDGTEFLPLLIPFTKFAIDFIGLRSGGDASTPYLRRLLGMVGAHRSTKYRRPVRLGYVLILTALFGAFPLAVYVSGAATHGLSVLQLTILASIPVAWFLINQAHLLRIADVQSVMMLLLSVSAMISILSPTAVVLSVFWLVNSNPLVALLLFEFDVPQSKALSYAPVVRPFDIEKYGAAIDSLLKPVRSGERVWLAFSDPGRDYNKIFDGLSTLYQAVYWRADARDVHALPDWYAVMEHNYDGAIDLWGREPERVRSHMREWSARYAIVYTRGKENMDGEFSNCGLRAVSKLSWDMLKEDAPFTPLVPQEGLVWWLLEDSRGV